MNASLKTSDPEDPLLRIYRFVYDSIGTDDVMDAVKPAQITEEWNRFLQSTESKGNYKSVVNEPETLASLLDALDYNSSRQQGVDSTRMHELCRAGQVDAAILNILSRKLRDKEHSAAALCQFEVSDGGGWSSRSHYETDVPYHSLFKNKKSDRKPMKDRIKDLFLVELFLREGNVHAACKTHDNYRNGQTGRNWKPIHKAIQNNTLCLVQQLLRHGAVIDEFYSTFWQSRYGSHSVELSTLYLTKFHHVWSPHTITYRESNKMLKVVLKHCTYRNAGNSDVLPVNQYSVATQFPYAEDFRPKEYPQVLPPDTVLARYSDEEDYDDEYDDYYSSDEDDKGDGCFFYGTLLHAAVQWCDVEMLTLLLIHGADRTLRSVKSQKKFYHTTWERKDSRDAQMREFIAGRVEDSQSDRPTSVSWDVFQILEKSKGDQSVKKEIDALLRTDNIWFPEYLEYYPQGQREALQFMFEEWDTPLPMDVVAFIGQYYYSLGALIDDENDGGGAAIEKNDISDTEEDDE